MNINNPWHGQEAVRRGPHEVYAAREYVHVYVYVYMYARVRMCVDVRTPCPEYMMYSDQWVCACVCVCVYVC